MGKARGNSPALQEFHCSRWSCRHQWKLYALDSWNVGPGFLDQESIISVEANLKDTSHNIPSFLCLFSYLCKTRIHLLMPLWLWSPVSKSSSSIPPLERWREESSLTSLASVLPLSCSSILPSHPVWACSEVRMRNTVRKNRTSSWVIDRIALPKQSIQKSKLFSALWWLLRCIKSFKLVITEESVSLRIEVLTRETAQRK